jgi:hypothetical protein
MNEIARNPYIVQSKDGQRYLKDLSRRPSNQLLTRTFEHSYDRPFHYKKVFLDVKCCMLVQRALNKVLPVKVPFHKAVLLYRRLGHVMHMNMLEYG